MLMIIALAAIAAYAIGASVVALTNDGLHRMPIDYTRLP
jgi:multisubunit Na+/H+ antiporter MnhG subunit